MTSADEALLGLFPLGLVLLPGEVVPLHIFEERYKLLIEERRDQGEFGIVLSEDDELRESGCAARVAEVIEILDDGRMNVLVQGGRRFRLLELREPDDPGAEYPSARVEYYDDAMPETPPQLRAAALDVFRKMLLLMDVESPREPGGEGPLSFRIAAAVDFVEKVGEVDVSVGEELFGDVVPSVDPSGCDGSIIVGACPVGE